MSAHPSLPLHQLTDEIVRALRPGDRVVLLSAGQPVAEVVRLQSDGGTRSALPLAGSLRSYSDGVDIDAAIEAAAAQSDRATRGLD